ncbi:maleylpyruvate isomerase family mycothiol-dependent enzyme [Aeromicrobium sp. CF3.5]|uniref:maleylpyruvate isomerase family mycothiol-dependent enzyme n=1 Tax=Aeromicrobium sp. CF3.5 TaxID=3373078 RepID=UPI003EE6A083
MTSIKELAAAERDDLAILLSGLSDVQLAAPSLCPGWSVRDVAVHVVSYDGLSVPSLPLAFIRGRFDVDRINEMVLRSYDAVQGKGVAELVAERRSPRGLTAGFGGRIALTDAMIHQQDIRRALHVPRTIPSDRMITVLDFALRAPTIPVMKNAKGLHLVARDIGWTHGSGAKVTGPSEALLMALAGRREAIAELDGPGVTALAERL